MGKQNQIEEARSELTVKSFLLSFVVSGRSFSSAKVFATIASCALIILFVRFVWANELTWDLMVGFASIFIVSKGFTQVMAYKYKQQTADINAEKLKAAANLKPIDDEEPED